jgi:hypothetical protein
MHTKRHLPVIEQRDPEAGSSWFSWPEASYRHGEGSTELSDSENLRTVAVPSALEGGYRSQCLFLG